MELTAKHRQALLSNLTDLYEDLAIREELIQNRDSAIIEFLEIRLVLLKKQIEFIEESIVNNNIDF